MAKTPVLEYPYRIVPFFSDYGFKATFVGNNIFSRKAIQLLSQLNSPIKKLELLRNEFEGLSIESRAGVFDVICRDEQYFIYILEMQRKHLANLATRLMYYNFHIFNSQAAKGMEGLDEMKPTFCICILQDAFFPKQSKYHWRFQFRSEEGQAFSDLSQIHLVELGKFPILQGDFKRVATDAEKLFYTMSYAHLIDPSNKAEVPDFFEEPWLAEALKKLDLAKMSPLERALLDISIMKERWARKELQEELQEKFEEGEKRGEKRGEKKGEQKGIKKGIDHAVQIIYLFQKGNSVEKISKETGLSAEEITAVIDSFQALQ